MMVVTWTMGKTTVTTVPLLHFFSWKAFDIFGAEITLSNVSVRNRSLPCGEKRANRSCQLSGRAGGLFATWSWRRLFTEPLRIEVNDLKILLRVTEVGRLVSAGRVELSHCLNKMHGEKEKRRFLKFNQQRTQPLFRSNV